MIDNPGSNNKKKKSKELLLDPWVRRLMRGSDPNDSSLEGLGRLSTFLGLTCSMMRLQLRELIPRLIGKPLRKTRIAIPNWWGWRGVYRRRWIFPEPICYYTKQGVLMRHYRPSDAKVEGKVERDALHAVDSSDNQMQTEYSRNGAWEIVGNLGVKKTFDVSFAKDASRLCEICHVCQVIGKTKQSPQRHQSHLSSRSLLLRNYSTTS